jgi:hypothetical protein
VLLHCARGSGRLVLLLLVALAAAVGVEASHRCSYQLGRTGRALRHRHCQSVLA